MFINLVNQNMNNSCVHNNSNNKVEKITNTTFQNSLNKFRQPRNTKDYKKFSKNKLSETEVYCPRVKSNNPLEFIDVNDDDQTLIEDKKTYEKFNLKEYNIEFNTEKFKIWKNQHNYTTYPPLNAPWQVRRTFREIEENVMHNPVAQEEFHCIKLYFDSIMCHPEDFDYPKDLDFSNPNSYCKLINLIIKNLKDVHATIHNDSFLRDTDMLNNILSILKIHNQHDASNPYIKYKIK